MWRLRWPRTTRRTFRGTDSIRIARWSPRRRNVVGGLVRLQGSRHRQRIIRLSRDRQRINRFRSQQSDQQPGRTLLLSFSKEKMFKLLCLLKVRGYQSFSSSIPPNISCTDTIEPKRPLLWSLLNPPWGTLYDLYPIVTFEQRHIPYCNPYQFYVIVNITFKYPYPISQCHPKTTLVLKQNPFIFSISVIV